MLQTKSDADKKSEDAVEHALRGRRWAKSRAAGISFHLLIVGWSESAAALHELAYALIAARNFGDPVTAAFNSASLPIASISFRVTSSSISAAR